MITFSPFTGVRPLRNYERVEQFKCRMQLYKLDLLANGEVDEQPESLAWLHDDYVPPYLRRQAE